MEFFAQLWEGLSPFWKIMLIWSLQIVPLLLLMGAIFMKPPKE